MWVFHSRTPVEYLQRVKVEAAKKQLEAGRKSINEVMYDVGYSDMKAFREVLKKIPGYRRWITKTSIANRLHSDPPVKNMPGSPGSG